MQECLRQRADRDAMQPSTRPVCPSGLLCMSAKGAGEWAWLGCSSASQILVGCLCGPACCQARLLCGLSWHALQSCACSHSCLPVRVAPAQLQCAGGCSCTMSCPHAGESCPIGSAWGPCCTMQAEMCPAGLQHIYFFISLRCRSQPACMHLGKPLQPLQLTSWHGTCRPGSLYGRRRPCLSPRERLSS